MKSYLKLIRIDKPIGVWLLFLPCLFGLVLAQKTAEIDLIYFGLLFFIGSFLMRSAGCVINDLFDVKFDRNVERTKNRPIASGAISKKSALVFLSVLLFLALLVLLQFNSQTIVFGFVSLAFVLAYPLMKRITFYPQIFLGLTFNLGILFASLAVFENIKFTHLLLYFANIFWTLIYDTIYGYQDLEDDLKVGVKSTAIKFGKNPQRILLIFDFIYLAILILIGVLQDLRFAYYPLVFLAFFHIACQIKTCNFSDGKDCLRKFKSNFWVGIILLIALILG